MLKGHIKSLEVIFLSIYWLGLISVFVLGWEIRSSLPSPPFMDPDTGGYLSPAVHLLAVGNYEPTLRAFVYPSFLAIMLSNFQDLNVISAIQHALGCVTAVLVVLIIFRSRAFLPQGFILDWLTRIVAFIGACGFLLFRSTILLEHSIRPEALFPAACALTILAGLEFSRRVFLEKRTDWLASVWLFVLVVFSIGTFYLKLAWGFAVVTSLLPWLLACFLVQEKWVWKLWIPFVGIVIAVAIFVLPETLLQKQFGERAGDFLPSLLLCAHAEFLRDILQTDALHFPKDSRERADRLRFVEDIRLAIQHPSDQRYGLALNPDDLLYGGAVKRLESSLMKQGYDFKRFCIHYYCHAWLKHPLGMLEKVKNQLWYFYNPKLQNVYDANIHFRLQEAYQLSLDSLLKCNYPPWPKLLHVYQDNIKKLTFSGEEGLSFRIKRFGKWLNNTFLPLLVISLIGIGIVFLAPKYFADLLPAAFLTLYLATFNFANCLTIAVVHMMSVNRYHFNQITMSLVSQAFELLFLVALIQSIVRGQKHKATR